jgi:hypothetical protein
LRPQAEERCSLAGKKDERGCGGDGGEVVTALTEKRFLLSPLSGRVAGFQHLTRREAVKIGDWFRKAWEAVEARKILADRQRRIAEAGGAGMYRYEQEEAAEWRVAISIRHHLVRNAFKLTDHVDTIPYEVGDSPHKFISEIIRVPPKVSFTFEYGPNRSGGGSDSSSAENVAEAEKCYTLEPRINGTRFHNPAAILDDLNPSPFVGFSYYLRHLTNSVISTRGYATLGPEERAMQFAPGLIAPTPQFAAIIHDGYGTRDIPRKEFAGFKSVRQEPYLKEPVRVYILGELDETGDTMYIRRLIIDGKKVELTRENVALGIDYAKNLVEQIFEGRNYEPERAMREALVSSRASGAHLAAESGPAAR